MTKILNLDDIETSIEKSIVIHGATYNLKPFSVEEFIDQMKEVEALGQETISGSEMYEMTLRMIMRAFPGLTDEKLRKLNTHQVDAIYAFLKAKTDEEVDNLTKDMSSGN